ncbi:gliding motility lipoprotein GldH [Rubrolithibacter danxiaensis]|uniref:gliding motility lipoprotein GldH n=1 Tax=Rubrolithibacter danxiaensis TaxID=3390805 RepID=UPI003BF80909
MPARFLLLCFFALSLTACTDNFIVDTSQAISNRNWSYIEKVKIPVTIEDVNQKYNLYINLRHTADYKYSNIFILIHEIRPDKKRITLRKEFKLAYPDGEWLGSGSGNIYTYQLPFRENYTFPEKGTYVFEMEQNMRDNPLREVTDVGLRVEPVTE